MQIRTNLPCMSANHLKPETGITTGTAATAGMAFYPLILDALGEAICMFDPRGEMTWQNKACQLLCGKIVAERHPVFFITDLFEKSELEKFRKQLYIALGGKQVFFEWFCKEQAQLLMFEFRPLRDEQQVIGVMCLIRVEGQTDIQDTPGAGLNEVFERVSDAFIALDKNWNYTYVNEKAAELHGRTSDELIGKNIWDIYPDVRNESFFHNLQRAMETQQPLRVELLYAGRKRWYENFIYPSPEGVSVYYRDITAYKNTEELLIRSEEQYRTLVEQAADAIIIADINGRCLDINSTAEKITGYTRKELYGLNVFNLLVISSGEPSIRMAELLDNKTVLQERKVRRKDGTYFYAELNSKLLTGDRILVIGRDITNRKKAEDALKESELRWKMALDNSELGVWEMNFEKKTAFISKKTREQTGYLYEENINNPDFWLKAIYEEDRNEAVRKFVDTLKGITPSMDSTFRVVCQDGAIKWFRFTGKVSNRTPEGRAKRIIGIHEHITERVEAQKRLIQSETIFREVTEHSPSGLVLLGKENTISWISESTRRITGYSIGDVAGKNPAIFTHPEDLPGLLLKMERLLAEPDFVFTEQYRFLYKDGNWRYVESTFSNLLHIRNVEAISINFRDIDDERRARIRLQLLSKATNDAVWDWDIVQDTMWWNEAYFNLLGFDPEGPVPPLPEWIRKVHPDDRDKIVGRFQRIRRNMVESWQDDFRFLQADNTWGTVLDRAFVIRDMQGKPVRVIGALVDISQQKMVEEKLQYEKMLSDSLIQKMPGIFYLYTRDGVFLRWNKHMEVLTGYSGTEIKAMHPLDLFEGDDKAIIRDRIRHHFSESLAPAEVCLTTKEKRKVPIYISSMAIIYEGMPCVVGIGTDISSLRRAEQALVESEEAFNRLFHESSEPILLLEGTDFIDCNDATVRLLGYSSREEFLFQSPWKLSPRKQPDGSFSGEKAKRMIRESLEKGYNRFEWVHRKADGSDFTVEVMITPVFMKGRQLFYIIWRDITDWKKAEANLQKSYKTISDYKYAIDQSTIVSFSDPEGNITYVNDNFVRLYGYTQEEIIGVNHKILNSGIHPPGFWSEFWHSISKGNVLKAEVCNKAKDGTLHWADTTIVPFLDEKGKPYQFLAIRSDITEKRKLEKELLERERAEQMLITETALEAQEKERNFLGQELHDNVNQILVGTKLLLNVVQDNPAANKEVLEACINNIQYAIDENRKLSHTLATPDMKLLPLPRQLSGLADSMFFQQPVKVTFRLDGYQDERLDDKQKITLYRIAQEQCTNINKYANASRVDIHLSMDEKQLSLVIADNGDGTANLHEPDGIGLRNIRGRVSLYGGNMEVKSSPGNGFTLFVNLPLR